MLAYFSLAFCRLTSLCSVQSTEIPNVMVYELWAKLKWNSYNKITWTYHFAQLGYHVDHVNVAYDDSRYLWYLQMVDDHPFASTHQNMSQQKINNESSRCWLIKRRITSVSKHAEGGRRQENNYESDLEPLCSLLGEQSCRMGMPESPMAPTSGVSHLNGTLLGG